MLIINLLKQRLGELPKDFKIYENGHSARGTIICICKEKVTFTACSDVGGIWVNCPKCGFYDI